MLSITRDLLNIGPATLGASPVTRGRSFPSRLDTRQKYGLGD